MAGAKPGRSNGTPDDPVCAPDPMTARDATHGQHPVGKGRARRRDPDRHGVLSPGNSRRQRRVPDRSGRRLRARLYHAPLSHQVIELAVTGQIRLAVVSARKRSAAWCAISVSITWLAGISDCGLYHWITQASGDAAVPVPSNPVEEARSTYTGARHECSDYPRWFFPGRYAGPGSCSGSIRSSTPLSHDSLAARSRSRGKPEPGHRRSGWSGGRSGTRGQTPAAADRARSGDSGHCPGSGG
jgi:hypothetical protein